MKKRIAFLTIALTLLLALTSCDALGGLVNNQTTPDTEHEHAYGEWEAKTPASCTEAGEESRVCDCGEEETRAIEALGHNYEAVVTEPTCTEVGYTTYVCACGDSYVGDEVASAGHSFDAVVTAPTCTEAGYTTYTCVCGYSTVIVDTNATGHKMIDRADETHHWSACANSGCSEATEKIPHNVKSIAVSYFEEDMMENKVLTAADFTVNATCECGKEYAVTEGVEVIADTLVYGDNNVTIKVSDVSLDLVITASKFYKVVDGVIVEDTHINSGNNGTSYGDRTELYIYNTGMYRVFFRFNFSDALNSEYYAEFGDEAIVQFSFTVTNGVDLTGLPITFKSYLTSEIRSSVNFSELTWSNYNKNYTLGWGTEDDSNNTVSLLNKEFLGDRATYVDGKLVITVTLRELEGCIDENGNAIFVLLTAQKDLKPYVASMENTEFDIPAVKVIYSNDHAHAYINHIVDDKYLASANCGEHAKYYVSCSCGETGAEIFNYGEIIGHSFGEFVETTAPSCTVEGVNTKTCEKCGATETESIPVIAHNYNAVVTAPTCTDAGYTTYTCICGNSYVADEVAANGHTYGEWIYDESYHWVECNCGDIANKSTHEGGEATETEQAVCDTCKQPYGGLASHVHDHSAVVTDPTCTTAGYTTYTCNCGDVYVADEVAANGHTYGAWETAYPATCEGNEVLIHYCDCGESETGVGQAAFGHDMQVKFDENNHWTECAHNCGKSTEAVAHFGGEATETEQAICEGCGQSYGELKAAEKQKYTINGAIVDDTYIYSSGKTSDYSAKTEMGTYSDQFRVYFRFNFSDILNSVDYAETKADAKVQFSFAISSGAENITSATKYTFRVFSVNDSTKNVDFSKITWTNQSASGEYPGLGWGNATNLVSGETVGDKVSYADGVITITVNFSDIEDMIDPATGNALFVFAIPGTKSIKIASMENTTYAAPAVQYVYEK